MHLLTVENSLWRLGGHWRTLNPETASSQQELQLTFAGNFLTMKRQQA